MTSKYISSVFLMVSMMILGLWQSVFAGESSSMMMDTPTITPIPDVTEDVMSFRPTSNTDWIPIEREFDGVMMVLVPAGCFDMGSNDGDPAEQPVHEICFDEPFWIDKYEVTNRQYGSIEDYSRCIAMSFEPDHPHTCVNWFAAMDFCEFRDGEADNVHLPTEAEWEYAARGVSSWRYPWGNEYPDDSRMIRYTSFDEGQTSPVGSRPSGASWVGAMDMSGNMWELVSSLYLDYPYDETHEHVSSMHDLHGIRGGSFYSSEYTLRASARAEGHYPWHDSAGSGFRCARSID